MTASKRDTELLLAELDRQPPTAMLGLLGPNATSRAAILNEVLSPPPTARIRTPGHRKLISTRVDASALPTYVLPWQHLVFKVLDALHDPALPNDRQLINSLRSELLKVTRLDPSDPNLSQASLDFARKFRVNFRGLVLNVATLANAIFVLSLEQIERAPAAQAAELLEAARYFLAAQGAVVLLSADEARLAELLSHSAPNADGRGILRAWLTGRVDIGGAATEGPPLLRPRTAMAAATTAEAAPAKSAGAAKPVAAEAVVISQQVAARPTDARRGAPTPAKTIEDTTLVVPGPAASTETRPAAISGGARDWLTVAAAALGVFLIDRISKVLMTSLLTPMPQQSASVLGDFVRLELVLAVPASFLGGVLAVMLELIGIGLTVLLVAFGEAGRRSRATLIGYGLIIGALGANLWERLTRGGVTNFLSVGEFPVFNFAHVALLVGAVLVLASLLRKPREGAVPATAEGGAR